MKKEFVMRGRTDSGSTETLNFSGYKPGMGYRITEFTLYPSTNIGGNNIELCGAITADKGGAAALPASVNFNDQGLIASSLFVFHTAGVNGHTVVDDTFIITQNLVLSVADKDGGDPVNWQCRFEAVKMSGPEQAVTNYKQFMISDGS